MDKNVYSFKITLKRFIYIFITIIGKRKRQTIWDI